MILRTTGSVNPITVEVKAAQPLRFHSEYRCELEPETLAYAVFRFLRHNPGLLRRLAAESFRLRFEKGKRRRPVRRRCRAPAMLLELPGAWATVDFLVGAEELLVSALTLSAEPLNSTGPKNRCPPQVERTSQEKIEQNTPNHPETAHIYNRRST